MTTLSMLIGASVYAVSIAFAVSIFSTMDHPARCGTHLSYPFTQM